MTTGTLYILCGYKGFGPEGDKMTCDKSFLKDLRIHWQMAYISKLSDADKKARLEKIEGVVRRKFAESTFSKWSKNLENWAIERDEAEAEYEASF